MEDWRDNVQADALYDRLDGFAASLHQFVETSGFQEATELGWRLSDVLDDPAARPWFERVLAFELDGWKQDAGIDRTQREHIEAIEQFLRQQVSNRTPSQ